jgi:hypothetical protein
MEQLRLFDPPQMILGRYRKAIEMGEWDMLPDIIKSLGKPENRPAGFQRKQFFWKEELSRLIETENKSPREMASYWEKLLPKLQDEALKPEARYLERHWFTLITDKLEDKEFDYLTGSLHPVFCLLKTGQYQRANEMSLRYFDEIGESAKLRTYQSFCLSKMMREREARTALTFALFYDPLSVDREFVFSEEIKRLSDATKGQHADSRSIRAIWPFEAWLTRLVDVPPDKELEKRITSVYSEDLLTKEVNTKFEAQIYFNHLLYRAEATRNKSPLVTSEVVSLRNRMKGLNSSAFQKYMERIV